MEKNLLSTSTTPINVQVGACLALHAAKQGHGIVALVVSMIGVVGGSHSWLNVNIGEGCPQSSAKDTGQVSPDRRDTLCCSLKIAAICMRTDPP